jgi:hypothetical protein
MSWVRAVIGVSSRRWAGQSGSPSRDKPRQQAPVLVRPPLSVSADATYLADGPIRPARCLIAARVFRAGPDRTSYAQPSRPSVDRRQAGAATQNPEPRGTQQPLQLIVGKIVGSGPSTNSAAPTISNTAITIKRGHCRASPPSDALFAGESNTSSDAPDDPLNSGSGPTSRFRRVLDDSGDG